MPLFFNLSVNTADDDRVLHLTMLAFLAFAALTAEAGDVETRETVERWRFYASETRRRGLDSPRQQEV